MELLQPSRILLPCPPEASFFLSYFPVYPGVEAVDFEFLPRWACEFCEIYRHVGLLSHNGLAPAVLYASFGQGAMQRLEKDRGIVCGQRGGPPADIRGRSRRPLGMMWKWTCITTWWASLPLF